MSGYDSWYHPYEINPEFRSKVAYLSMEFGIHQPLKIYSGGLGFLAGSHMRSAFDLKQNVIGIGILWKTGYYDQDRKDNQEMEARFRVKTYTFLEDTGIRLVVPVKGYPVKVKVMLLRPEIFGTAPIYLLSSDMEENEDYFRGITNRLYDVNHEIRIAQYMILGIGGAKLLEKLGGADVYHLNEAHAAPFAFYYYKQVYDLDSIKKKLVFTTHTPEKAGNDTFDYGELEYMGYFSGLSTEVVKNITGQEDRFGTTPALLALSKRANGVSKLHGEVSRKMWLDVKNSCEIISITNAQNARYWKDGPLYEAMEKEDREAFTERKKELKKALFEVVADQTGKLFDENVLTIVWARRFAAYKRANLLLRDINRFWHLIYNESRPVQVIWAGKPYPEDGAMVNLFNTIQTIIYKKNNCAILTGYELHLSRLLKGGADIWLNNPRRPREASGTSGMTAAMNGAINLSTNDGWIPEFAKHGKNSWVLPALDENLTTQETDKLDYENLMHLLEQEIVPMYYKNPLRWNEIAWNGMKDVIPAFDSDRMAREYYHEMYDF